MILCQSNFYLHASSASLSSSSQTGGECVDRGGEAGAADVHCDGLADGKCMHGLGGRGRGSIAVFAGRHELLANNCQLIIIIIIIVVVVIGIISKMNHLLSQKQ